MTTSNEVTKHILSIETAVSAITNSLTMGRKALNMELAVCLAIYAAEGNSEKPAKDMVAEVYVKAGYDASNSTSRHYKTVNRRVNAAAGLFNMVGAPKVLEWMGKTQEDKLIVAVLKGLEEYKFDSMDDVLDFCGRPSNRTSQASQASPENQAETGQEGQANQAGTTQQASTKGASKVKAEVKTVRFSVGKVRVELPEAMGAEDMIKLASKILRAAREKEQVELRESLAHPSTAPNPVATAVLH